MSNKLIYKNTLHHLAVDYDGTILKSDNTLFNLNVESNITDFHPIFISALPLIISQEEKTLGYPGLSIQNNGTEYICDLTIKRELDFIAIVFFNFTSAYKRKQEAIQQYNELEIKRALQGKSKAYRQHA